MAVWDQSKSPSSRACQALLGSACQEGISFSQNGFGGGFVLAAGSDFLNDTRAVAVLSGVGPSDNHDTAGAVLPCGHGCRSAFLFRVEPFGEPLSLANGNLRARRQSLSVSRHRCRVYPFAFRLFAGRRFGFVFGFGVGFTFRFASMGRARSAGVGFGGTAAGSGTRCNPR